MDDGSTDGTESVTRQFIWRIRNHGQANSWAPLAGDDGIRFSTEELVVFLEAVDPWPFENLDRQWAKFKARPASDQFLRPRPGFLGFKELKQR